MHHLIQQLQGETKKRLLQSRQDLGGKVDKTEHELVCNTVQNKVGVFLCSKLFKTIY